VNYFVNLFSPETRERFSSSTRTITGFRPRHRTAATRVKPGDVLVCYMTRLSRWVGLLEVVGEPFEDASPIFAEKDDPFVVRLRVRPLVWLPPIQGIPIHDPRVWNRLSMTRDHDQRQERDPAR
jgi:predicted RNA-binding protein